MEKRKKNQAGITLIALVITIIVLLILAGVTISLVLGNNGILNRATNTTIKHNRAQAKEKLELVLLDLQSDKIVDKNYKEENIDKKVTENGMNIGGNIVIVDGWKFLIDRSVPKIVEDLGNEEAIAISTPYIGTTSFTTKVAYIDIADEVEEYIYVIDGIESTSKEIEYTKEEFEAESTHTAKVIAKYKNGKTVESNTINVKLEPRTYLYNNGDACEAVTGGWKAESSGCGNSARIVEPNLNMMPEYMNMQLETKFNDAIAGGSVVVNNKIDYSQYKKICCTYVANLAYYNMSTAVQLFERRGEEIKFLFNLCYSEPVTSMATEKVNLIKSEEIDEIFIYLQVEDSVFPSIANANIYEIWLEK